MPVQINFLRQRRKKLTAQQELDKRYAMYAGYVSAGIFVLIVIIFILEFLLKRNITSVKAEQRRVESAILDKAAIEKEYLILGEKLTLLQGLVKDKGVKQQALEYFSSLLATEDVVLTQVIFSKEDIIQFDVQTNDVFQYRKLLHRLQGQDILSAYPHISVTDLSRLKNGSYTSTLTVILGNATQEEVIEQ